MNHTHLRYSKQESNKLYLCLFSCSAHMLWRYTVVLLSGSYWLVSRTVLLLKAIKLWVTEENSFSQCFHLFGQLISFKLFIIIYLSDIVCLFFLAKTVKWYHVHRDITVYRNSLTCFYGSLRNIVCFIFLNVCRQQPIILVIWPIRPV